MMNYLLNSGLVLSQARARSLLSVNQANLNPTRYGEIPVPLPPPPEQARISDWLDDTCSRINALDRKNAESITLLRERRSALITAAVTGQIDVSEYANE